MWFWKLISTTNLKGHYKILRYVFHKYTKHLIRNYFKLLRLCKIKIVEKDEFLPAESYYLLKKHGWLKHSTYFSLTYSIFHAATGSSPSGDSSGNIGACVIWFSHIRAEFKERELLKPLPAAIGVDQLKNERSLSNALGSQTRVNFASKFHANEQTRYALHARMH